MFNIGDRIQMHPATDAWMKGDRYGIVVKVTKRSIHIELDSGRVIRVASNNFDLIAVI